ncbi:hypothetical protein [Mangrovicoccus algicola]|nr:hypothetical protein [Mangrovicoccus algicola]
MKQWLGTLWTKLNPAEPSPAYLGKLMAFNVTMMTIALLIGRAT